MSTAKGLSNPLAIATATQLAQSKNGQKAIAQTGSAIKLLFMLGGGYLIFSQGWKQFKKIRARNFADANIGNADLIAASIIYKSFTRVGFDSGPLGWLFGKINISTDEASLYKLASEISNIKGIATAYKILFDRNLNEDLNEGFDNKELKKFWAIFSSELQNTDMTTIYAIGDALYSAIKGDQLTINIAEKNNKDLWVGTGKHYGNFITGDFIGYIIAQGKWTHKNGQKENYYIIQQNIRLAATDGNVFEPYRKGVVLQHQVTNKKP